MTESWPPRVTVTLPGGRTVEGRLHARRQRADGTWWYEVAIAVPAAHVAPVDGEDYSGVPIERAEPAEPRYVVVTAPGPVGGPPKLTLHKAGCWAISPEDAIRITPVASAELARTALRFDDTVACDVCEPEA